MPLLEKKNITNYIFRATNKSYKFCAIPTQVLNPLQYSKALTKTKNMQINLEEKQTKLQKTAQAYFT